MRASVTAVLLAACGALAAPSQPNLIFVLIDDWGFANVGYHREPSWPGNNETVTPNIDRLALGGLRLERNYVFKYCSPTRSALQTGRNPIHVNVINSDIRQHNKNDPEAGMQGAARSFTGLAEKLRDVGYMTAQAGKWNAGVAHESQTPHGRGYESSLFYFDYDTWFYNETLTASCPKRGPVTDLSTSLAGGATHPARRLNNTWACSQANQSAAACPHGYQDDLFIARVEEVIANASRTPDVPLFLFYAPHAPHDPYEVPDAFFDKFSAIDVEVRQYYSAMVNYLDTSFGRLEAALRASGRWDNTLVVVSSDNGGPADYGATAPIRGGNNFPLRGSKATNWEGGIRVNAFAFGGALDPALEGTVTTELTAIEDWWTTFALLGGANTTDERAAAAGLPGVDGLDLRGLFVRGGNRTSPRTHVIIGDTKGDMSTGNTTVGGILRNDGFKLLLGHVGDPVWQGPVCEQRAGRRARARAGASPLRFLTDPLLPPRADPNKTVPVRPPSYDCSAGCLFNVFDDPHELNDVAAANPAVVAELKARVAALEKTVWSPWRGADDGLACEVAFANHSGFIGPFLTG